MNELFPRLRPLHGVILCVVGLATMALGGLQFARGGFFVLEIPEVMFGLASFGKGLQLVLKGSPTELSDDALQALLNEDRPLSICLDCRVEVSSPRCSRCKKSSGLFAIRTRADTENALALLGLEGTPKA